MVKMRPGDGPIGWRQRFIFTVFLLSLICAVFPVEGASATDSNSGEVFSGLFPEIQNICISSYSRDIWHVGSKTLQSTVEG